MNDTVDTKFGKKNYALLTVNMGVEEKHASLNIRVFSKSENDQNMYA